MNLSNFNLSDVKKNALLQMAGKKLGADPAELSKKIEDGNVDDLVKNLDPNTAAQLNGLLQNPQALNALLGSDQVKALLGALGQNNK